MAAVPVCAHLCPVLADAVADAARGKGIPERVARIGRGLSPEYLPLTTLARAVAPPRTGVACTCCGQVYDGPHAITAARECADLDTGTTD